MKNYFHIAVALALFVGATPAALAAPADYKLELATSNVKTGKTTVDVRLVDRRTGKPVPGADVSVQRIDMSPMNMAAMTAPAKPAPSDKPGVYRFSTTLGMAGPWSIKLSAKLPRETAPVTATLVVTAAN